MKIKLIHIDNYKVIKDFTADVQGRSFMLMGKNGVGKTSVEQFIQYVLGNPDAIPPDAEINGFVVTTKDGHDWMFKVETKNGKKIVVMEGPDGMKVTDETKGKGKIAQTVGAKNFNPHRFIELSKTEKGVKEQIEIWKNIYLDEPTRIEILRLEENVKSVEMGRTEIGRDITKLKGAIASHPLNNYAYAHKLDEFKPVDITEITVKHAQAVKHNGQVERSVVIKEGIESDLRRVADEIAVLQASENVMKERLANANKWLSENIKQDTSDLDAQIKSANESNEKHKGALELKGKVADLGKLEEEYGEHTANIHSQRTAIQQAIRGMGHSVDGLVITEDQMIYRDVPVHSQNLSMSERMELAWKMNMAANPEFKFIFIEDSNLLDEDKWNALLELKDKYDMQIIAEEVVRGQKTLKIEIIGEKSE